MEATNEIPLFQHTQLDDAKACIRLLKVLSIDLTRQVPVHCEISTWPSIDEAPKYYAVSYTWGDEIPVSTILINGERMDVRSNCEYVLKQTNPHVRDGYLWVDAICINQVDNDEKSEQVANMGQVFKRATQVLACVGQHQDDSEFLCRMVREDERRFRSWRSAISKTGRLWFRSVRYYPGLLFWKLRCGKFKIARLQRSFVEFLNRPYFHRVWIYQELSLAQDVKVLCGNSLLPISCLCTTCFIPYMEIDWTWRYPRLYFSMPYEIYNTEWLLEAGIKRQDAVYLDIVLHTVNLLHCQDPRDRIYGILSVINWEGRVPIQPDYNMDELDLAIQVLERFSSDRKLWQFLMHVTSVGESLELDSSPSKRLTDMVQDRLSSGLEATNTVKRKTTSKTVSLKPISLAGLRLLFHEQQWRFQQYLGKNYLPKIHQWGDENTTRTQQLTSDIILPPEAQDGDWLLMTEEDLQHTPICLLARHDAGGSDRWELIGKVLSTKSSEWSPKCIKLIKSLNPVFMVHMDAEDAFALLSSRNWKRWHEDLPREENVLDQFFKTRLCKERYSSFVTCERPATP